MFPCNQARHLAVPHYEGLELGEIFKYAVDKKEIHVYFPDCNAEIKKLPRNFIVDLIYSAVGEEFRQWVANKIKARNQKVVEKQDLDLKLDPEILKAFQSSYSVSCMHLSQRITNHYCRDERFWSSLDEIWVKETSWSK